jgi:SAM-dependent methyltransferase
VGLSGFSGRLLDVGAGDRWIEAKLPSSAAYVALDFPATGRDLYAATPHVFADAAALPFTTASFDGVVCLEVLEHVKDPAAVMLEIARVLKPGGTGWLSMPFLYPVHDSPFDFQRWTGHGWIRSASGAGLEVADLRPSGSAIESAGVLACLALAGPLQGRPAWQVMLAAPVVLASVPAINLAAWAMARIWPRWGAMSTGLQVELRKP